VKVALIQLETILDRTPRHTRLRAAAQVQTAAEDGDGSQLVVLPELWAHGAFDPKPWPDLAEPIDGEFAATMRQAAVSCQVVLHAGSFVERAPDGAYYNTSLVYDFEGESLATYRKIHRFGFDQGEAAFMAPGTELAVFELADNETGRPLTTVGLATCYDLRFPELFRKLVDGGAKMVVIPAAWPARRREHWRTLLRARAIENQVYVIACAAVGTQGDLEMSGHSLVVDPWGEIVAEGGTDEEIVYAEIDPELVDDTRERFPVLRDRRL
jgi:predicted amidohydrolase